MPKRRNDLEPQVGVFLRQYGCKRRPNMGPNDRQYSRKVEKLVKRMDPEEFAALLGQMDEPDQDETERRESK